MLGCFGVWAVGVLGNAPSSREPAVVGCALLVAAALRSHCHPLPSYPFPLPFSCRIY